MLYSLSLGHFVCVFCIHACTLISIVEQFLFSFPPATICSPLGTLIMANECSQAQSLIYLHRPKTQSLSLLFLHPWPFPFHTSISLHLFHNTQQQHHCGRIPPIIYKAVSLIHTNITYVQKACGIGTYRC